VRSGECGGGSLHLPMARSHIRTKFSTRSTAHRIAACDRTPTAAHLPRPRLAVPAAKPGCSTTPQHTHHITQGNAKSVIDALCSMLHASYARSIPRALPRTPGPSHPVSRFAHGRRAPCRRPRPPSYWRSRPCASTQPPRAPCLPRMRLHAHSVPPAHAVAPVAPAPPVPERSLAATTASARSHTTPAPHPRARPRHACLSAVARRDGRTSVDVAQIGRLHAVCLKREHPASTRPAPGGHPRGRTARAPRLCATTSSRRATAGSRCDHRLKMRVATQTRVACSSADGGGGHP